MQEGAFHPNNATNMETKFAKENPCIHQAGDHDANMPANATEDRSLFRTVKTVANHNPVGYNQSSKAYSPANERQVTRYKEKIHHEILCRYQWAPLQMLKRPGNRSEPAITTR